MWPGRSKNTMGESGQVMGVGKGRTKVEMGVGKGRTKVDIPSRYNDASWRVRWNALYKIIMVQPFAG